MCIATKIMCTFFTTLALVFFKDMDYPLGFPPEYGSHDLFIYCDLIQKKYVGDTLVPLHRIVIEEAEVGQRVSKLFMRPQYLLVSCKQFETIKVSIKTETGASVSFEFGVGLLTLHFRRCAALYF